MIQHGSDLRFAVQDELFSFSRDQLALESRHPGPGFRHRLTAMSNGRASKVQRSENKTFLDRKTFALNLHRYTLSLTLLAKFIQLYSVAEAKGGKQSPFTDECVY